MELCDQSLVLPILRAHFTELLLFVANITKLTIMLEG